MAALKSNSQEALFDAVMDNLKPFSNGKSKKALMCSGSIPLTLLFVDDRYQGLRKHTHLQRLKSKWDVRKLTPIILVPHCEEKRFAIVDGQGRFLVATDFGYDSLQAIVLMDAPQEINERLKFEAEYFIGQDTEAEKVKPLEKHLARVIIGDPAAVTVDKLLIKYGISVMSTKGPREKSVLGSYSDTYSIAKIHGEKCLDFIFSIISNTGWDKESNGYSSNIMRALKDIWVAHPKERVEIHSFLSENLRQLSPELFVANGKTAYPKRQTRTACVLYIEDLVCNSLGIKRKIYHNEEINKYKIIA